MLTSCVNFVAESSGEAADVTKVAGRGYPRLEKVPSPGRHAGEQAIVVTARQGRDRIGAGVKRQMYVSVDQPG